MSTSAKTIAGVNGARIKNLFGTEITGWHEIYSINFAEQPNSGEMDTGDTVSIDGTTWTADINGQTGDPGTSYGTVAVVGGAGLEIVAGSNSDLFNANTNIPFLSASVSDMLGGTPQKGDILCVQTIVEYSGSDGNHYPTTNFEAGGCMFWNGVKQGDQRFVGGRMIASSNTPHWGAFQSKTNQLNVSLSGYSDIVPPAWETVFQIMGQGAIVSSGPFAGTATLQPPLQQVGAFSDGTPPRAYITAPAHSVSNPATWTQTESQLMEGITTSNAGIMLYCMKVSSSRAFKTTFKNFRIFRARRNL